MLILFIIIITNKGRKNNVKNKTPLVPHFIIFFILFALINSIGFIPNFINSFFSQLSNWCLLIAISAVGTKTRLQNLKIIGFMPAFLMLLTTLFLMSFIIIFI